MTVKTSGRQFENAALAETNIFPCPCGTVSGHHYQTIGCKFAGLSTTQPVLTDDISIVAWVLAGFLKPKSADLEKLFKWKLPLTLAEADLDMLAAR